MSSGPLAQALRVQSDAGERIGPDEGLYLLRGADLLELAARAESVRYGLHPDPAVSFVIDTNPNYTNVCTTACRFCAFARRPAAADAYVLSVQEVMAHIETAVQLGATTVLLQGGHNPALPLRYYLDLVRETCTRFPGVTPHFFSATEVRQMAQAAGCDVREVLRQLWAAGQRTLPGGGAEVLSDRVRRRVSPNKGTVGEWLEVHRAAHEIGFRTTATMMYGHLETDEDIIEHLDRIRALQDETSGFTAFTAWSFKPGATPLSRRVSATAGACRYLRITALARVYLDNFAHIQASWFSEGKQVGQAALHFGADDFGGTLLEENVHRSAGYTNTSTLDEVLALIRGAGFRPVQRTTLYETVRSY
ncbi:MAG: dehypoxanthine futalosine cyclase [Gammaproteobacteria bacterium]|nr:dehypoxanthine futalosine cyclase [Gammaproteobacteria bacterium]